MFLVEDEDAIKRYRYILSMLSKDDSVDSITESTDGNSRELTVTFKKDKTQPTNPSLHHLKQVYGSAGALQRLSPVDRILNMSSFDD